jgi:hypothetical protein
MDEFQGEMVQLMGRCLTGVRSRIEAIINRVFLESTEQMKTLVAQQSKRWAEKLLLTKEGLNREL